MRSFKLLFLVTTFLICTSPSFGEGTAGARGGGTGILCENDKNPILLEEYMLKQKAQISSVPETENERKQWLDTKLESTPGLSQLIQDQLSTIGSFDSWEPLTQDKADQKKYEVDPLVSALVKSITERFPKIKFDLSLSQTKADSLLQDDFFDFPKGCQKIQLSGFLQGKVYRIYPGELSNQTKNLLELHEAFYLTGIEHFEQNLPAQTRDVLVAMNGDSEKSLKKILKNFTGGLGAQGPKIEQLNTVMELVRDDEYGRHLGKCPLIISNTFDGTDYKTVTIEPDSESRYIAQVRTLFRFGRSVVNKQLLKTGNFLGLAALPFYRKQMKSGFKTAYFSDEEKPFFPGLVKLLIPQDHDFFILDIGLKSLMEVDYPIDLSLAVNPKLKKTATDERITCTYKIWTPDGSGVKGTGSEVKILNQDLLNTSSSPNELR